MTMNNKDADAPTKEPRYDIIGTLDSILQAGGIQAKVSTLGEAAMTWLQVSGCEEMASVPCVIVNRHLVYFEDNVGPEGFQGVNLETDEQVMLNMPQWMAVRWLQRSI